MSLTPPQWLLWHALRPLLARNRRFQNAHRGETCYILGNGGSLKSMDLRVFSDQLSIGLNLICLHRDFRQLHVPYYAVPEAFFFYPWFWSSYLNRYEPNVLGRLLKDALARYPSQILFTSASNIFGTGMRRRQFLHHFGHREVQGGHADVAGIFSFMAGALAASLGLAIYLGFSKAILLGCDYMFSPMTTGHFYSQGPPQRVETQNVSYDPLLHEVNNRIDLLLITDTVGSQLLPAQTYESYSGRPLQYRENTDLVEGPDLQRIAYAHARGQYHLPILSPNGAQA